MSAKPEEKLAALATYISSLPNGPSSLPGWSCSFSKRDEKKFDYYYEVEGKNGKFRSRVEVARFLGLITDAKKRNATSKSTTSKRLAPEKTADDFISAGSHVSVPTRESRRIRKVVNYAVEPNLSGEDAVDQADQHNLQTAIVESKLHAKQKKADAKAAGRKRGVKSYSKNSTKGTQVPDELGDDKSGWNSDDDEDPTASFRKKKLNFYNASSKTFKNRCLFPKRPSRRFGPAAAATVDNDGKRPAVNHQVLSATTPSMDPNSPEGLIVSSQIKVYIHPNQLKRFSNRQTTLDSKTKFGSAGYFRTGRIIRYDQSKRKHLIAYAYHDEHTLNFDENSMEGWVDLQKTAAFIGGEFIWGRVNGKDPLWPAQAFRPNDAAVAQKLGRQDHVGRDRTALPSIFFNSSEYGLIKNVPSSFEPYMKSQHQPSKGKPKKYAGQIKKACQECDEEIALREKVRRAVLKECDVASYQTLNTHAAGLLDRDVKIYRPYTFGKFKYPTDGMITGHVEQYSTTRHLWLVSFNDDVDGKFMPSGWFDLHSPRLKLDVPPPPDGVETSCGSLILNDEEEDAAKNVEFLGSVDAEKKNGDENSAGDGKMAKKEKSSPPLPPDPKFCVLCTKSTAERERPEFFQPNVLQCSVCEGYMHSDCLDPPMPEKELFDLLNNANQAGHTPFVCQSCKICESCHKKDKTFGCYEQAITPTKTRCLCYRCTLLYQKGSYCHLCNTIYDVENVKKSPTWGMDERTMLCCDYCKSFVHAACCKLAEEEFESYDQPETTKSFFCLSCQQEDAVSIIEHLTEQDLRLSPSAVLREKGIGLFTHEVTEDMAPTYRDVVKQPMDLWTMITKAKAKPMEYRNLLWIKEGFELMVYNALLFNDSSGPIFKRARTYHEKCLAEVFGEDCVGEDLTKTIYADAIDELYAKAKKNEEIEKERTKKDETAEKKDLVVGTVATVSLPDLVKPKDPFSCIPTPMISLTATEAKSSCWMESCFVCGSSGCMDTMIYCVDCGEAFHSFCTQSPIFSLDEESVASWRCPNCKICEISGSLPKDEADLIYCDMCDRAFNISLLNPPLESSPPPGISWFCGYCVTCQECTPEQRAQQDCTNWSCDPLRCYIDGGAVKLSGKDDYCPVCRKFWLPTDNEMVECESCHGWVHASCDEEARRICDIEKKINAMSAEEKKNNKEVHSTQFTCLVCSEKKKHKQLLANQMKVRADEEAGRVAGELQVRRKAREDLKRKRDGAEVSPMVGGGGGTTKLCQAFTANGLPCSRKADEYEGFCSIHAKRNPLLSLNVIPNMYKPVSPVPKKKKTAEEKQTRSLRVAEGGRIGASSSSIAVLGHAPGDAEGGDDDLGERSTQEMELKILETQKGFVIDDNVLKEGSLIESSVVNTSTAAGGGVKTSPTPMCGWTVAEGSEDPRWTDVRQCCFCQKFGDSDAGIVTTGDAGFKDVALNNDQETINKNMEIDSWKGESTGSTGGGGCGGNSVAKKGRLLPIDETGGWAHYKCAYWTSDVFTDEVIDNQIPLTVIRNVFIARQRTSTLKAYECPCCGIGGASIGCCYSKCPHTYHFECAVTSGRCFFAKVGRQFKLYCNDCIKKDPTDRKNYEIFHPETFPEPQTSVCIQYNDKNPNERAMFTRLEGTIKKATTTKTKYKCRRTGSLVIHDFGEISNTSDSFHSEDHIFPLGFCSTRIFWSPTKARTRCIYVLRVEADASDNVVFRAVAINQGEAGACRNFEGRNIDAVYEEIRQCVLSVNKASYGDGKKNKMATPRKKGGYGLSGSQFWGFGITPVRELLENLPGVEAVTVPLKAESKRYLFAFKNPTMEVVRILQRKRAGMKAEAELQNANGCARLEGPRVFDKSAGEARITRVLLENEEEAKEKKQSQGNNAGGGARGRMAGSGQHLVDFSHGSREQKYWRMKSVPLNQRLQPLRSHIHGWGLFTKIDLPKNSMIIEYVGQRLRSAVGDIRERNYENSGIGSCYMFRIDKEYIVDATMIGCMARFMNHCCQPNAYADVIQVHSGTPGETTGKIVVMANQFIPAGSEITYDYKFPVEDGSLRCTCGHPNCIGRMN